MTLAKDRNTEEGNRWNVGGCRRPSNTNSKVDRVFHLHEDCAGKEKKTITTVVAECKMIESVQGFIQAILMSHRPHKKLSLLIEF